MENFFQIVVNWEKKGACTGILIYKQQVDFIGSESFNSAH